MRNEFVRNLLARDLLEYDVVFLNVSLPLVHYRTKRLVCRFPNIQVKNGMVGCANGRNVL